MQLRGMRWLAWLSFGLLASAHIATNVRAQCVPFRTTYVDPTFTECSASITWEGSAWGGTTAIFRGFGDTLDHDGLAGAAEDMDPDAIFSTISAALACTQMGGTVQLLVPGAYREAVTITQSVTLRGPDSFRAVLEGDAPTGCPGGVGIGFDGITIAVMGAGDQRVQLENIEVHGFSNGVTTVGPATNLEIRVVNSVFDGNTTGMNLQHGERVDIVDSSFTNNSSSGLSTGGGFDSVTTLVGSTFSGNGGSGANIRTRSNYVTGCSFSDNGSSGISLSSNSSPSQHDVERSRFLNNGSNGITYSGPFHFTQPNIIRASDCNIAHNGGHGIRLNAFANGVPDEAILTNNVIQDNSGDGVNRPCIFDGFFLMNIALYRNTITSNGGFSVNADAAGVCPTSTTLFCNPGHNVLGGPALAAPISDGLSPALACGAAIPGNVNQLN